MSQRVMIAALSLSMTGGSALAQAPGSPQGNRDQKGGFISDKTKKKFSEAQMEDITNENFPDLIESFDYPNAEISDIVKAISELTGKNFIIDTQVRGKITIIAPSQITVAEAYKAFLSALAINGLTVVPGEGFLKIKQARQATRDSIETYAGAYYPTSDIMITRILKLKYISADEVNKNLRNLATQFGEVNPYPPTNSLIISDFGSNVDRMVKIINQLDVPGFEEQLEVIRVRYAKAKDLADLLDQIITKGEGRGAAAGGFAGVPRFRRSTPGEGGAGGGSAENYSLVLPDDRTNSIIVVGNQAGIEKIRKLIGRLDFRLRPEDAGGVNVYYVRHSEAEKIAEVLNGLASESRKAAEQASQPKPMSPMAPAGVPASNIVFGGDVKVTADKITNSLIITASKPDFEVVKSLLAKIDIPRDQVFVRTVIMELSSTNTNNWGIDYYKFARDTNGIGRIGFRGGDLTSILNPGGDAGLVAGLGSGSTFNINIGGAQTSVTDTVAFINFLKKSGGANVLSEPTIMALDNEEAEIEVGEKVPVATQAIAGNVGGAVQGVQREDVTIKLTLTPYISPDTDSVQMKIKQDINEISNRPPVNAAALANQAISTTKRNIKTQIVVNSGDTAVLGGLMQDKDTEQVTKIPVLGDIPILGWLFKSKRVEKDKKNLLVFLTPKIVRNADDNASILNQKLNDRLEFIQKNLNGRDPFGEAVDALPRRAMQETNSEQFSEEPAVESF